MSHFVVFVIGDNVEQQLAPYHELWDWYVVGGRWSSWLQAKTGAKADSLRKGEVDFAGMRKESADKAAVQYDKAFAARNGQDWITWDHMRDVLHKDDINAARTAYNEQPALKALRAVKDFEFLWTGYDEFLQPRDQFIQHAHDSSVTPFAVLLNGAWHERGSMGWWGADEQDANARNRKVTELLDNLSDDTLITVVDCHI